MNKIPLPAQNPQRQDSLTDQIKTVRSYFRCESPAEEIVSSDPVLWTEVSNLLGCYDAADHFSKMPAVDWITGGPLDPDMMR